MSGYDAERATILGRLETAWANRTPVDWPNRPFDPPTDKSPFIRPTLLPTDAARREIGVAGSRTFRHHGLLLVQVLTDQGVGEEPGRTLAEAVCAIFRAVVADGITYEGPTGEAPVARADGDDGHGWYMWTVTVPYTRDALY